MTGLPAPVLLVGCGRMGGALLAGWIASGADRGAVLVVEPEESVRLAVARAHGVRVLPGPEAIPADFVPAAVVFAVKPQLMAQVLPPYRRFAGAAYLSIAAGRTISWLEARLGEGASIVRAMPNSPAAVGRGITVACAARGVTGAQRRVCEALLAAVGEVAWIEDEGLMDAVTAVSGSGPAYVFLLAECLAAAGAELGLPGELAARLARATVAGSGELLRQSGESAARLREGVTSPGGTTAAALSVLMAENGLCRLLARAVAAAAARSRELAR